MAIQNRVLFGLKVDFNFSDAESKLTALSNLGLDYRDLEVIRGVSDEISDIDLQNVSGLDVNIYRYLDRLQSDTSLYNAIVNQNSGYFYSTKGNLEAYGPLSGGAVRFKFIPNDKGSGLNQSSLKFGDISTSRVSSWSSSTSDETDLEQAISYGASVQCKGTLKVGQKLSFTPATGQQLININDTPEPIRFTTEVPTDMIELDINGTTQFVYAMRGIPIIFTTAFRNLSADFEIIPFGTLSPIFTIQATDFSESEIQSTPTVSSNISRLRYNSQSYKERYIKLYYPPANIKAISAPSLNIRYVPKVKLLNLESINYGNNLIGEMPDWQTITYTSISSNDLFATPDSKLKTISINDNPLYESPDETLRTFGSNTIKKLPKTLTYLNFSGTYYGNSEILPVSKTAVILATLAEYNLVKVNRTSVQTFTFTAGTAYQISGVYYDKYTFDGKYYVYVDSPSENIITMGNANPSKVSNLDISTRTPGLRNFITNSSSGRYYYNTVASKTYSPDWRTEVSGEWTPKVNIKEIQNYNIYNNDFRYLSDVFVNPAAYLVASENSSLSAFNVGSNYYLTSSGGSIDFTKMTSISSISIGSTALPIPTGLQNKSTLSSVDCTYTRFPTRNAAANKNTITGDGNWSNANNNLFTDKNPLTSGQYVFQNCSSLSSLSFYSSYLDGFIPKFVGNTSLNSIDFRYTSIEGGRPPGNENQGQHGRRYIMWDDTFADSQYITSIQIRSQYLGRNIGEYSTANGGTFTNAAFQANTFALPLLTYLEIVSTGQYIRGPFFNTASAPSLTHLISPSTGWGQDLVGGTNLPTFAGNPNIYYVDLSGNKFTGNIQFSNLPNFYDCYISSNNITGITSFVGLSNLDKFIAGNNPNLTGAIPNFSVGSPRIRYISLNNCKLNSYSASRLNNATRLVSLDLSNNLLSTSNVDQILTDLLANYNNAPRSGVQINLLGNAAPSRIVTNVPTQSVSIQTENKTVAHQQPTPNFGPQPQRTITLTGTPVNIVAGKYLKQASTNAYAKVVGVSGTSVILDNTDTSANTIKFTNSSALHIVDSAGSVTGPANLVVNSSSASLLLSGTDPGITNDYIVSYTTYDPYYSFTFSGSGAGDLRTGTVGNQSFATEILQNGVDITNVVNINYATNTITYPGNSAGNVTNYPPQGATLTAKVTTTTFGTRQEVSGGVTLVSNLQRKGWIVRTE